MPNYPYNQDIPDSPNNPSLDQPNMKINTNSTFSILDVDLYGFGDTEGGYHQQSTYVAQGSAPVSDATHSPLYGKVTAGINEIYLNRFISSVDTPVQLTSGATSTSGSFGSSSVNRSFLPGGFKVQFGNITTSGGGSGTITFSPAFSTLLGLNVSIAAASSTATVAITAYSATSANVACNAGAQVIGYFAIGT